MTNSSKVLFLLHLPQPVHGSSMIGLSIKESIEINHVFDCEYINLTASQQVSETGKFNLRKIVGFMITFAKLFWTLSRKRPQLCYLALTSTGIAFYKDLILIALIKAFRIKRVYHMHNKGVSLHQNQFINRICYRFVFSSAQVILLSKNLFYDINKFVKEESVHICQNGIPDLGLHEKTKEVGTKNIVRILFLSNLRESKGVFVLLEALALLTRKGVSYESVFIGAEFDISVAQFNSRVLQLGISDFVIYQGAKYGEEKEKAILEADIFIFPTCYETFGLVLLEAMSYSLPVVSTFEGGIPDIVEDGVTGYLAPQRNVELLAEKLELLIMNPELRRQMGEAGRKKFEKEFTLEIFEQRLIAILQKIIKK